MPPTPKITEGTWPVRFVFWGLLVAVIFLSLDAELNIEIPVSQTQHNFFVVKVNKDPRQNSGGQREIAPAEIFLHWNPSFRSYLLTVVDKQNLPVSKLRRSAIIRAPPSVFSS